MERTEEQKLLQESVVVVLGGKSYEIKPLVIREAAVWRRKFFELFGDVLSLSKVTSDEPAAFNNAMAEVLLNKPDKLTSLFFEYAKDLDKEEIENSASSRELLAAIQEVFALEAPFFGAATKTMAGLTGTLR